jgi:DNA primase catalytic subunit
MILEDKSRRTQAERGARKSHRRSQKLRSRKVRNIIEAQEQEAREQAEQTKPEIEPEEESELIRVRERKTSEAAELLSKALGADGVALLLKAFSEEEQPRDLLSALRRRLQVAMALKNGT